MRWIASLFLCLSFLALLKVAQPHPHTVSLPAVCKTAKTTLQCDGWKLFVENVPDAVFFALPANRSSSAGYLERGLLELGERLTAYDGGALLPWSEEEAVLFVPLHKRRLAYEVSIAATGCRSPNDVQCDITISSEQPVRRRTHYRAGHSYWLRSLGDRLQMRTPMVRSKLSPAGDWTLSFVFSIPSSFLASSDSLPFVLRRESSYLRFGKVGSCNNIGAPMDMFAFALVKRKQKQSNGTLPTIPGIPDERFVGFLLQEERASSLYYYSLELERNGIKLAVNAENPSCLSAFKDGREHVLTLSVVPSKGHWHVTVDGSCRAVTGGEAGIAPLEGWGESVSLCAAFEHVGLLLAPSEYAGFTVGDVR